MVFVDLETLSLDAALIMEITTSIYNIYELQQSSLCIDYIPTRHSGVAQIFIHSASPGPSSQPLSSIRLPNRFSIWRDVFTATVSSLQALRTFNKIACEDSGREMTETPVDAVCHYSLATSISDVNDFQLGLVIFSKFYNIYIRMLLVILTANLTAKVTLSIMQNLDFSNIICGAPLSSR